jgi:hypothetical protein
LSPENDLLKELKETENYLLACYSPSRQRSQKATICTNITKAINMARGYLLTVI